MRAKSQKSGEHSIASKEGKRTPPTQANRQVTVSDKERKQKFDAKAMTDRRKIKEQRKKKLRRKVREKKKESLGRFLTNKQKD
jgi:hypothetical protein